MRQDTLGKWSGFTREHVNRFLAQLKEWGIISWMGRHYQSNIYYVNPAFRDHFLRSKLKHIFSALAYFHIGLLEPNVTLINSFIYKTQIKSSYQSIKDDYLIQDARAREGLIDSEKKNDSDPDCKAEKQGNQMIQPYVEGISNPVMTDSEKKILSRYSREAVMHALSCLQRTKDIQNPVGFLVKCAQNYKAKASAPARKADLIEVATPRVYEMPTKAENDRRRLSKLIYLAEVRGEYPEYIDSLSVDTRPIIQIENSEWERVKALKNKEAREQRKSEPFVLGTVAPRASDDLNAAESSSSTQISAQSVPPPTPSRPDSLPLVEKLTTLWQQ